jgi:hypothetical protein
LYRKLLFDIDDSLAQNSPFLEIPASMMEKMLEKTNEVGTIINDSINNIKRNRAKYRSDLQNLIRKVSTQTIVDDISTCGVDGSYIIERLLGTDLLFACALICQGLNSNSKKEVNVPSNYEVFVRPERHDAENAILARAIMLQMEIKLASNASNDVIYVDGSLTTALIHMYKAVNMLKDKETFVSNIIKDNFKEFLDAYRRILTGYEYNKIWIGIPKYTSRNDIGNRFGWPDVYDDRAILTMLLEPGEYTEPVLFTHDEAWHSNLPYQDNMLETLMGEVIFGIRNLYVMYFKPFPWSPALRIEMPYYIANDEENLEILLQNIKQQCEIPSILEPFPLFMADRIAKRISPAIPAYKQIIQNQLLNEHDQDENDTLFMMHSYRTEPGYN